MSGRGGRSNSNRAQFLNNPPVLVSSGDRTPQLNRHDSSFTLPSGSSSSSCGGGASSLLSPVGLAISSAEFAQRSALLPAGPQFGSNQSISNSQHSFAEQDQKEQERFVNEAQKMAEDIYFSAQLNSNLNRIQHTQSSSRAMGTAELDELEKVIYIVTSS